MNGRIDKDFWLPWARVAVWTSVGVLALVVFLRTAWISDDAMITFRSVLNFVHGWGPTYNLDERVQSFTHPLWFMLMAAGTAISGNVVVSAYAMSFVLSLAVVLAVVWRPTPLGVVAAMGLIFSKAFVDFATSGLENPLANVLILVAVGVSGRLLERWGNRMGVAWGLLVSAVFLTRADLLVMLLPMTVVLVWQHRSQWKNVCAALAVGAIPAVVWTIFSLYYYGQPWANPAYAKLNCGIGIGERIAQGLLYLIDSWTRDKVTLPLIIVGGLVGWMNPARRAWVIGGLLYLLGVVAAGGDFMSGRFLVAPLVLSAVLLAQGALRKSVVAAVALMVAVGGMMTMKMTLASPKTYNDKYIGSCGIADERGYYYADHGLWNVGLPRDIVWQKESFGLRFVRGGELGWMGFLYGPSVHVFDDCALADPLLARLPMKYTPNWRVGHYYRQLPTDYLQSLRENKNLLTDPATREYYEVIRHVTRGPLNAPARWWNIVRLNMGWVRAPRGDLYRRGGVPITNKITVVPLEKVSAIVPEESSLDNPAVVEVEGAIEIVLPQPLRLGGLAFSATGGNIYEVGFVMGGTYYHAFDAKLAQRGLCRFRQPFDVAVPRVERVRITPIGNSERFGLISVYPRPAE